MGISMLVSTLGTRLMALEFIALPMATAMKALGTKVDCRAMEHTHSIGSGETSSGEWDCGVLKLSLPPSNNSVQGALQAARKAANDVFCAPRLEEQVNNAVASAKKSSRCCFCEKSSHCCSCCLG